MGNLSQLQGIGLGAVAGGVASSAVTGLGEYESGQQTRSAYDYNAAIALERARQQQQTTEANYSSLIGKQASAFARSGVDIASGSPLLVMLHTAAQSGVEQESEAQAGNEQAALLRYYGRVAAFNGTMSGISSFLSGLAKGSFGTAGILGPSSDSSVPTVPLSMFGDLNK